MGEQRSNLWVELLRKGGIPAVLVVGGLMIAVKAAEREDELGLIVFLVAIGVVLLGVGWVVVAMWGKALLKSYQTWKTMRFRRRKPIGAVFTTTNIVPVEWCEALKLPEGAHEVRGRVNVMIQNTYVMKKKDRLQDFLSALVNYRNDENIEVFGRAVVNIKCYDNKENKLVEEYSLVFSFNDPRAVLVILEIGSEMPAKNRKRLRDHLTERIEGIVEPTNSVPFS